MHIIWFVKWYKLNPSPHFLRACLRLLRTWCRWIFTTGFPQVVEMRSTTWFYWAGCFPFKAMGYFLGGRFSQKEGKAWVQGWIAWVNNVWQFRTFPSNIWNFCKCPKIYDIFRQLFFVDPLLWVFFPSVFVQYLTISDSLWHFFVAQ